MWWRPVGREDREGGRGVFLGEFQHTLDVKGRVSLPAKFRNAITGSLVVAKGMSGSLYVYTPEVYESFVNRLMAKDDFDPRYRKARLFFTSGATEVDLDSAGRLSLPQTLREYAGLTKEVTVVGNFDRIEVWDSGKWTAYNGDTTDNIEDITRELSEEGVL